MLSIQDKAKSDNIFHDREAKSQSNGEKSLNYGKKEEEKEVDEKRGRRKGRGKEREAEGGR